LYDWKIATLRIGLKTAHGRREKKGGDERRKFVMAEKEETDRKKTTNMQFRGKVKLQANGNTKEVERTELYQPKAVNGHAPTENFLAKKKARLGRPGGLGKHEDLAIG